MKFFTFSEYFIGTISFIALGIIISFLSSIIYLILNWVKDYAFLIGKSIKNPNLNYVKNQINNIKITAENNSFPSSKLGDCLVVSLYSLSLILMNYSLFDGVVRLFPIFLSVIAFLFFKNVTLKISSRIFCLLKFIPERILIYIICIAFIPIKFISKRILVFLKRIVRKSVNIFKKRKNVSKIA